MAQTATHLVDHVIPHVPVRQWVLSLPIPLRLLLAARPKLVTVVLQVVHRVITRHLLGQAGLLANERVQTNAAGQVVPKAEDSLARRHHASIEVAAGVHTTTHRWAALRHRVLRALRRLRVGLRRPTRRTHPRKADVRGSMLGSCRWRTSHPDPYPPVRLLQSCATAKPRLHALPVQGAAARDLRDRPSVDGRGRQPYGGSPSPTGRALTWQLSDGPRPQCSNGDAARRVSTMLSMSGAILRPRQWVPLSDRRAPAVSE